MSGTAALHCHNYSSLFLLRFWFYSVCYVNIKMCYVGKEVVFDGVHYYVRGVLIDRFLR